VLPVLVLLLLLLLPPCVVLVAEPFVVSRQF
jgi:hypothetical protein